ncbi:LIM domain transcription factor LMO4.1-like isoform X2 [Liolophura sinensis]
MAGLLSSTSSATRATPPSSAQMMIGQNMNMNMNGMPMSANNNNKTGTANNNNNTMAVNNMSSVSNHSITTTPTSSTPGGGLRTCSGCGEKILDRFLLHAMDRFWHTACLKCSYCHAELGNIGTSCFTKKEMLYCKNDYLRLFGSGGSCSSCGQTIPASEFVMKAQGNVYHQKCFTCVVCQCQLVPGNRYSILNGSLVCEQDYPKVLKGHVPLPNRPAHKVC